jgi:nitrogen fixation protein FixH
MSIVKRGTWWPIGITAILGITVAGNIWVMRIANDDPSMVVESDYYRKAIRWDDEMAQARRNVALRWTLTPSLSPVGPSQRAELRVALTDSTGAPLPGARVTLEAFAVARSANVFTETLAPAGDGYRASIPVATTGRWELRFTVERDGQRFTSVQRLDAVRATADATTG